VHEADIFFLLRLMKFATVLLFFFSFWVKEAPDPIAAPSLDPLGLPLQIPWFPPHARHLTPGHFCSIPTLDPVKIASPERMLQQLCPAL